MNPVNPQTSPPFLLKPFPFLGINPPLFIWLAAGGLLLVTVYFLGRFFWIVYRESRLHAAIVSRLNEIKGANHVTAAEGLSPASFDAAGQLFEISEPLQDAWRGFQRQVFVVRNGSGKDRFYSTDSADEAFNDSIVIDSRINRNFYSSFPGIVTGLGLLFTFIAILLALTDLRITPEKVRIALATPAVFVPKNTKPALPPLSGFDIFEIARSASRTAKVVRTGPRLVSSSIG